MKRMLNLLALTALSTSAIPTVGLVALNSNVVKNLSLKDTPVKDDFKTPLTGTSGDIYSLSTDKYNNIYAGGLNVVYKCLAGQTKFTAMSGTSGWIMSLAVDNHGKIYAGSYSSGVYKSNGTDPFTAMTGTIGVIESLIASINGDIYALSNDGTVYKSNGINSFIKIMKLNMNIINSTIDKRDNIYASGKKGTIYKYHLLDNLITSQQPDYFGHRYNGFVYNKQQTIDLLPKYLKSETLDGQIISVSSKQHITAGKHTLVLTVKDEAQQYLDLFGGNIITGEITYNFWVKTAIDSNTEINYSTISHDTDLLIGLMSNTGKLKIVPLFKLNKNKNQWFKQVSDVASRGFATATQMQQIKDYLNGLDFSNFYNMWFENQPLC